MNLTQATGSDRGPTGVTGLPGCEKMCSSPAASGLNTRVFIQTYTLRPILAVGECGKWTHRALRSSWSSSSSSSEAPGSSWAVLGPGTEKAPNPRRRRQRRETDTRVPAGENRSGGLNIPRITGVCFGDAVTAPVLPETALCRAALLAGHEFPNDSPDGTVIPASQQSDGGPPQPKT